MGDIVEYTSWANHKNLFYEVTSNGINFDIKSNGPARVGLTNDINNWGNIVWVLIDEDSASILDLNDKSKTVKIRNILNGERYKRFWIFWSRKYIILGLSRETTGILQSKYSLPGLIKYVTFSSCENGPSVQWRLELSPILKEPSLKPLLKGTLTWVECGIVFPNDAVVGGFHRESLYIIRANHRDSLTPGVFIPLDGCAYIPWGGASHEKTAFEVLCGIDYKWVQTKQDRIPIGAFEAGYSEVNNEPLYIGRAMYNGSIIPGKVQPSHRVCYICSDALEVAVEYYEILTVPNETIHYSNLAMQPILGPESTSTDPSEDGHGYASDSDNDNPSYEEYLEMMQGGQ